mgnify:CR=1 FL=1
MSWIFTEQSTEDDATSKLFGFQATHVTLSIYHVNNHTHIVETIYLGECYQTNEISNKCCLAHQIPELSGQQTLLQPFCHHKTMKHSLKQSNC